MEKIQQYHDVPGEYDDLLVGRQAALTPTPKPKRTLSKFTKGFFVASFVILNWTIISRTVTSWRGDEEPKHAPSFKFEDITPSEKLEWHACFDEKTRCARLTVPMDYNRPLNASANNPKVHIALVLIPGAHNDPKNVSVSPLFVNPGGPGGSGTAFVTMVGTALQSIIDPSQDVIGFDPRGIAATTPRLDCFSEPYADSSKSPYDFGAVDHMNGLWKRAVWAVSGREIGLINSTASSLSKLDTRARLVSKLCQQKDDIHGENSIFRHLGTPNVARDMVSIIDAWDEWRKTLSAEVAPVQEDSVVEINKNKYAKGTEGKLVYWGFSYGTLLGATFAGLFPDRVGRLILDGVVDADQYVSPVWADSITDADAIFKSFPKYCFEGKTVCSLYKPGDTFDDVKHRFYSIQESLKAQPLSFIGPYSNTPITFTYDDFKLVAFGSLYDPVHSGFKVLAYVLDAIASGNHDLIEAFYFIPPRETFCQPIPESILAAEAQLSILCGDKRYPLNDTLSHLEKRFETMSKLSSFASVWMSLMMGCDGWSISQIDPPLRWGKHPVHKYKPIKTSFPVLFLSNTYDPVTPLFAGVKMASKFVDAGFLEQQSMGHCTLSTISFCTLKTIKEYYTEGKVPSHPVPEGKDNLTKGDWEKCEPNEWPFKSIGGLGVNTLSVEQLGMMKAAETVQETLALFNAEALDQRQGRGKTNVLNAQSGKCGQRTSVGL